MYGHKGLLEHEQTVTTTMWVAVLPRWMRSPLSAWAFRAQKRREPEDWATGRLGELASGVSKVPNFCCLWDVGFSGDGAWCQAFAPISHGCWPEGSSSTESSYPGRDPGSTLLVLSWCCCCCWLWQVSVQE